MTRQHLPNRRRAVTFDVKPGGATYSVGIGLYDDNRLGEVFLSGSKTGSDMASLINDAAVLVSITLQYGTPVSVLRAMGQHGDQAPATVIGCALDRLVAAGDFAGERLS